MAIKINNELIITELTNESIQQMIYIIRGKKVMLDFELAHIYGYETKNFNRQITNNINRFDEDFRFQLNDSEFKQILKCKNFTSRWGGTRKLPYAFTEQGIYMLMTVLKGDLAIKQSKVLIRTFKQMKDYIIENQSIINYNSGYILDKFKTYDQKFDIIENKLEIVMDQFIDPTKYKHFLIKDGEKLEADLAYQNIYKQTLKSIYIIDDYVSIKTLQLLKVCPSNINIVIITDNLAKNKLTKELVNDFENDTNIIITFKCNKHKFHDRYIVIDYNTNNYCIYHCGASSKDAGCSVTTIMQINNSDVYIDLINEALKHQNLEL